MTKNFDKIYKQIIKENTIDSVELTDPNITNDQIKEKIKTDWPEGLTYKGREFFDSIYMNIIIPFAMKSLKIDHNNGQECYLGYLRDKDIFVSGFDTWGDEIDVNEYPSDYPEGGRALYKNAPVNVIFIKLDNNFKPHSVSSGTYLEKDSGGLFYSDGGYNILSKSFPNKIDLRLD